MDGHTRTGAWRAAVAAICLFAQAALVSLHSWHHHNGVVPACAACLAASTNLAPVAAAAGPSQYPALPTGWVVDDSPGPVESRGCSVACARAPPTRA